MIEYTTKLELTITAKCSGCGKTVRVKSDFSAPTRGKTPYTARAVEMTACIRGEDDLREELDTELARRGWATVCGACRDASDTDKASCG